MQLFYASEVWHLALFSSRAVAYFGRHLDMSWSQASKRGSVRSLRGVEEYDRGGGGVVFGSSEYLVQKLRQKYFLASQPSTVLRMFEAAVERSIPMLRYGFIPN